MDKNYGAGGSICRGAEGVSGAFPSVGARFLAANRSGQKGASGAT